MTTTTKERTVNKTTVTSIVVAYGSNAADTADILLTLGVRRVIQTPTWPDHESRHHGPSGTEHQMNGRGYCHTCMAWTSLSGR